MTDYDFFIWDWPRREPPYGEGPYQYCEGDWHRPWNLQAVKSDDQICFVNGLTKWFQFAGIIYLLLLLLAVGETVS